MSSQQNETSFAHSTTEAQAILKVFRRLPGNSSTIVAELAILAGSESVENEKKQRFLNGSFYLSKSLTKFASSVLDVAFGENGGGVKVTVKIGNFHCSPNEVDGTIYENYTGFLNELTIGF